MDEFFEEYQSPRTELKPVLVTPPAVVPVTLAEAKRQCNVLFDDDDSLLEALADVAIEHLDGYAGILGRALINQSWRQDYHCFGAMRLPLEPLVSITSVKYYDADNVQQTLAGTVYEVVTDNRGPIITLKYGQTWPTTYSRRDAVSVTFVAGYGEAATDVPAPIRHAARLHLAHMYKYREMDAPSDYTKTDTYQALTRPFVRTGY